MSTAERAVVLLSGGLDSAVALAVARRDGYTTYALSARYGQRHEVELEAACKVAAAMGVTEHRILDVGLGGLGGSALTDPDIVVPRHGQAGAAVIPPTYVPGRNTVLLALAMAWVCDSFLRRCR
jgi:7-cyano-7-deazaguanine synthase